MHRLLLLLILLLPIHLFGEQPKPSFYSQEVHLKGYLRETITMRNQYGNISIQSKLTKALGYILYDGETSLQVLITSGDIYGIKDTVNVTFIKEGIPGVILEDRHSKLVLPIKRI